MNREAPARNWHMPVPLFLYGKNTLRHLHISIRRIENFQQEKIDVPLPFDNISLSLTGECCCDMIKIINRCFKEWLLWFPNS